VCYVWNNSVSSLLSIWRYDTIIQSYAAIQENAAIQFMLLLLSLLSFAVYLCLMLSTTEQAMQCFNRIKPRALLSISSWLSCTIKQHFVLTLEVANVQTLEFISFYFTIINKSVEVARFQNVQIYKLWCFIPTITNSTTGKVEITAVVKYHSVSHLHTENLASAQCTAKISPILLWNARAFPQYT